MAQWSRERLQAFVDEGMRQIAREEATDAVFEDVSPETPPLPETSGGA